MENSHGYCPVTPPQKTPLPMPTCALCASSYFGHGNVCAPLGALGDRCCDSCNTLKVIPARIAAMPSTRSPLDGDLHMHKRFRTDDPALPSADASEAVYVASEQATDECAPGIEFETPVILHGVSKARCAVKPPCPEARPERLVVDVYVGVDNTYSMRGTGSVGLTTVLKNFSKLVQRMFDKAPGFEDEDIDRARAATALHLFTFGETAACIDGVDDFVSFGEQSLDAICTAAAKQMKFDEGETNIESAVQYASEKAHQRFVTTRAADEAADRRRVACFVLVTDGSVNAGERSAQAIVANADAHLSDACRGMPVAFYAIGLGESTNPTFLTAFAKRGFWKHVTDPHNPVEAFDTTIGTILSSVGVYEVQVCVGVEREGELLEDEQTSTSKKFGLMTRESCRARILDVPIPLGAIPGDVLKVTTTFGAAAPVHSRIPMGTATMASGVAAPLAGANTSDGLFAEAHEIEQALESLKESVTLGQDFHNASDTLIKTSRGSFTVQSQIRRYTNILENSLSCSSGGTMAFVPQGVGGYSATPSRWAVESSFSQLN